MTDISHKINLSDLFGMRPEAAISYLKSKGLHIGWNWQDTLDEAHARSFTIAKMTDISLLADTRRAIVKAMESGGGYQDFVRQIKPLMQEKGWWGKQTVINPYGDQQEVQLGSPRRLRTIYHTNRRIAVMAAQYQRMLEAVETHPYWQYWAILDGRTRKHHAAMHGTVYAWNDPFWQHNYPPNGYGCRCTVKALTRQNAETASIHTSELTAIKQDIGTDKSTGEIYTATRYATAIPPNQAITQGLSRYARFAADAGFNGSPAASHLMDQMWLQKAIEALGKQQAMTALSKDMTSEARVRGFLAWVRITQNMKFSQHRSYGVGILSAKAIQQFQYTLSPEQTGSPVVAFKDKIIAGKKARRHESAGNELDMQAYEKIIREFSNPDYELWDKKNKHLLLVFKQNNEQVIKLSIKMTKTGAEVISGFSVLERDIKSGIISNQYIYLK